MILRGSASTPDIGFSCDGKGAASTVVDHIIAETEFGSGRL
jgi:hypothetical protein